MAYTVKDIGKGEVSHHPKIAKIDLQKLYSNFESLQDPVVLQEKVQFDIRFYFFGEELKICMEWQNPHLFIRTDVNTGRRYIQSYQWIEQKPQWVW